MTPCVLTYVRVSFLLVGEVYAWGSALSGKLGLGPINDNDEAYCSVPRGCCSTPRST